MLRSLQLQGICTGWCVALSEVRGLGQSGGLAPPMSTWALLHVDKACRPPAPFPQQAWAAQHVATRSVACRISGIRAAKEWRLPQVRPAAAGVDERNAAGGDACSQYVAALRKSPVPAVNQFCCFGFEKALPGPKEVSCKQCSGILDLGPITAQSAAKVCRIRTTIVTTHVDNPANLCMLGARLRERDCLSSAPWLQTARLGSL